MDERIPNVILRYRKPLVISMHVLIWVAAFVGAFLIRFDFHVPSEYFSNRFLVAVLPLLVFRLLAYGHFGLFQGMWRYTGQRDLQDLSQATLLSSGLYALSMLFLGYRDFPRSVFIVELMLTVALVGGIRFASRALFQATEKALHPPQDRMLIIGAGDHGETLLREVLRKMSTHVEPVGFLDDNPAKLGMKIHGIPVLAPLDQAQEIVNRYGITQVVIAIPRASGQEMREIIAKVSCLGISVRTIPALQNLISGQLTVSQLREIRIEDLLGREPVELDKKQIGDMVRNEVVLITGAGGSIGSELCRQVCRFRPKTLILVEQAENALYQIHRELTSQDIEIVPKIADVVDLTRLKEIFSNYRPGLVIHAAAHKHVPMMEWNPGEAIKNNVGGTKNVADLAHEFEARRFVMISTDKAVNPTSIMGCTKRVAELYVQAQAQRSSTRFITVRFGNVLGSNGSVIPLFREQIQRGGPVTVTHPEMQRYFMTIPEASQLVLQSAAFAKSGEVYVLDMGKPVRITTLAEDLIRLSGLEPHKDIQIEFCGTRPGEKLFEELSTDAENAECTTHKKIFVGRGEPRAWEAISVDVAKLISTVPGRSPQSIRSNLRRVVPNYRSPEDGESPDLSRKVIPIR